MLTGAASLGASLIARVFERGPQPLGPQEAVKQAVRAAVMPQRWILGQKAVGGLLCYIGAKARKLRLAFVLHNGPGEALLAVRVRGELVDVTKAAASALHEPASSSEYHERLKVWYYGAADGTEGVEMRSVPSFGTGAEFTSSVIDVEAYEADPSGGLSGSWSGEYDADTKFVRVANPDYGAFSSDIGDIAEYEVYPFQTDYPLWDETHKLNGRTWVFVELDQPVWENIKARFFNRIPDLEFVIRGLKFTWPGQSTPAWTRNRAAQIYWWLRVRRGFAAADIDETQFADAFATCDEDVTVTLPQRLVDQGFATTSKRYHGDLLVSSGDDIDRVEGVLEAGMCGRVVMSNGKLQIRPGRDREPVLELDDSWTLEPPVIQPWQGLEERFNAIDLTIAQSFDHEYTEYFVGRFVDDDAKARDGELRVRAIHLPDISEPIAGARIQAILLRENRESRFLTGRFRPGDDYELIENVGPGDVIAYGSDALGHATANWRVLRHIVEPLSGIVTLACREELDGTYDDTLVLPEDKQANIFKPPEPTTVRVEAPSSASVDEQHAIQDDGSTVSSMLASWTNANAPVTQVQWRSRPSGGAWGEWSAIREVQGASDEIRIPGVSGTVWRVRVRHARGGASASRWVVAEAVVGRDTTAPGATVLDPLASISLGLALQWTNPSDHDYAHSLVQVRETDNTVVFEGTVSGDNLAVNNLVGGVSYKCRVRAVDFSGNEGAWSNERQRMAGEVTEGADGEDGQGVEYVFAVTSASSIASNQRPSNDWGFDEPATVGGLQWHDGAPDLTQDISYLWRSARRVPGLPEVGDEVSDDWSVPRLVGRYGPAGTDGDDGQGVEYVFAVTGSETLPSSQRPSNDWGFDEPATVGGLQWHDGAPDLTADESYLWRAQRALPGSPEVGDDVTDEWSVPAVVGRFGPEGPGGSNAIGHVLSRDYESSALASSVAPGEFQLVQAGGVVTILRIGYGPDLPYLAAIPAGTVVWIENDNGDAERYELSAGQFISSNSNVLSFLVTEIDGGRNLTAGDSYDLHFTFNRGDPGEWAFGRKFSRTNISQTGSMGTSGFRVNQTLGVETGFSISEGDADNEDYFESIGAGSGVWFVGDKYAWRAIINAAGSRSITTPRVWHFNDIEVAGVKEDATVGDDYRIVFTQAGDSAPVAEDTVPSAPTSLTAAADGTTAIDLSWSAPLDNGGQSITGYRIDVSSTSSSAGFSTLVASQTATSYEHSGLDSGDQRWYRVYAINSVGTSTSYASASATTGESSPGTPAITGVLPGVTGAIVTVSPPSDWGSGTTSSRKFEWRLGTSGSWTEVDDSEDGFSIAGLTADTDYTVYLRAKTDVGTSSADSESFTTDAEAVTTAPGTPAITGVLPGVTGAVVTVSPPSDWGSGTTSSRKFEWRLGTSGSWTEVDDSEDGFSIAGLTADTDYTVYLRAKTDDGTSSAVSRSFTTNAPVLSAVEYDYEWNMRGVIDGDFTDGEFVQTGIGNVILFFAPFNQARFDAIDARDTVTLFFGVNELGSRSYSDVREGSIAGQDAIRITVGATFDFGQYTDGLTFTFEFDD